MIYKIKASKVRNEKLNIFDVCLHNLAVSKFLLKHLFLFQLKVGLFSAQRLPNVTNHKLFVSNLKHGEHSAPRWVYGWVMMAILLKKSVLNHLINWKEKLSIFMWSSTQLCQTDSSIWHKTLPSLWRTVQEKWSKLKDRALFMVSEQ